MQEVKSKYYPSVYMCQYNGNDQLMKYGGALEKKQASLWRLESGQHF